jgi:hypothetical protein
VHDADEIMAEIVAKRHFERAGFVVMKRPAEICGGAGARFRGRLGRLTISCFKRNLVGGNWAAAGEDNAGSGFG